MLYVIQCIIVWYGMVWYGMVLYGYHPMVSYVTVTPSVVNMRISHPPPPITRRSCQSKLRLGLIMELSRLEQKLNCVAVFSQTEEAFNLQNFWQKLFLFFDAAVESKAQASAVCKIGCIEKKQQWHQVASIVRCINCKF